MIFIGSSHFYSCKYKEKTSNYDERVIQLGLMPFNLDNYCSSQKINRSLVKTNNPF